MRRLGSSENRLLMVAIAAISLVLPALGFGLTSHFQNQLEAADEQYGSSMSTLVATGVSNQMASPFSQELRLQSYLNQVLGQFPAIYRIRVLTARGQVLAELTRHGVPSQTLLDAVRYPTYATPIRHPQASQKILGSVSVTLDNQSQQQVASATKTLLTIVIITAWVLSILAVVLNTYLLSKHLRRLVSGVQRLSTGDFGYKISELDLWGELKTLARAFNDMSIRLRLYEDQNIDSLTLEKNKLHAVLLSIADGVIVCDNDGRATMLNEPAAKLLSLRSNKVLVGLPISDFMTVNGAKPFEACIRSFENPSRDRDELDDDNERSVMALNQPHIQSVTLTGVTARVIISPILDANQTKLGFVMIMHDVTKEMEIDRLKTSFISNVSHELRTPVTTIKSYVDTLCNHGADLDKETYQEFLDTVNLETDRLKRLVNDILDFSRLQEGVSLAMEPEDVGPIINLTVQSMKVLAQQKHLSLSTAVETNLPKVVMNADSIERVLRNLLSNAIKYTDNGGRIKCKAELVDNGRAIEVSVNDTGMGIPAEHLPYIFDRFYRVENQVHTVKGTGLGLHLVKMTIEDYHQGQVFVSSEPGEGSTFGFRLPIAVASAMSAEDVSEPYSYVS